ncbi:unnamed protein product [Tetraodon nigroviridis]|uniref:mitogen-activated protein kinase n=1 Tax=Tetraodon nigroviridis TaxID=99883 RepID=Q4T5G9_TETNG|nr:unnamed protein product [Tetraodon nigroviridis]
MAAYNGGSSAVAAHHPHHHHQLQHLPPPHMHHHHHHAGQHHLQHPGLGRRRAHGAAAHLHGGGGGGRDAQPRGSSSPTSPRRRRAKPPGRRQRRRRRRSKPPPSKRATTTTTTTTSSSRRSSSRSWTSSPTGPSDTEPLGWSANQPGEPTGHRRSPSPLPHSGRANELTDRSLPGASPMSAMSKSVTDPRDGKRVALKKMPNVFQNLVSCKRVFRELKMLCFFKHENVLSALDILQPPHIDYFEEIYVVTELMQSDLHKIIVSPQPLSSDHAKVFLYQILRGLKYLHSAGILHRDIKPGNLLVNSNCVLKICDFGLARVEESDEARHMTQEVVTQYYRAPEILMGSRHYSNSIDIWSVGCIFAELLGRRILFQAQSPIQQLDLITDLLGTPSMEAMRTACEGARAHILRGPHKQPSLPVLYTLSSQATHEAVHLLCRMLVFDPSKRISAKDALAHPYLDEGRLRYHTCMCKCCYTTSSGRVYTSDFEPVTNPKFDDGFEKNLSSVRQVKGQSQGRWAAVFRPVFGCWRPESVFLPEIIHQFILEQQKGSRVPLCINPQSAAFKSFISSTVAQPSEMPPSPLVWE